MNDNSALTSVIAPGSTAADVSDTHRLLVVGTRDGKLLVYPLKQDGSVEDAPAQTIDLPRSAPNQNAQCRVVSVLFHPRQPLLYVWQNFASDATHQAQEQLPHLVIYRCSEQRLQLASALVQGPDFGYNRQMGMLALDSRQERLFIPSGIDGPKKVPVSLFHYSLTAQGLPAQAAGAPRPEPQGTRAFFYFVGNSIVPGPKSTVLLGALSGPCFVNLEESQVLRQILVPDTTAIVEVASHPQRPLYYFSAIGSGAFLAMEHVDGILTQLPRTVTLQGVEFKSRPVVMTPRNQVAVGSPRAVVVIDLDKEGWPSGKARMHKVDNLENEAAAPVYSEKFNRLYVPVK